MTAKPALKCTRETIDLEARFLPSTEQGVFEGYASVFGETDSFGDTIKRGAFKKSIKASKAANRPVVMLWSHDAARPIGTWDTIEEDEKGLHVVGRLLRDLPDGDLAYKAMKGKALNGLSIGFRALNSVRDNNTGIRTLTEIELLEISLVALPAMSSARVNEVRQQSQSGDAGAVAGLLTALRADTHSLIRKV